MPTKTTRQALRPNKRINSKVNSEPPKEQRAVSSTYALAYACALPTFKDIARQHGYCLAVHGSMSTDMDLIAVPWTECPEEPDALIKALCDSIKGRIVATPETDPKPHGRLAWSILPEYLWDTPRLDLVPWIDISIMPPHRKQEDQPTDDTNNPN